MCDVSEDDWDRLRIAWKRLNPDSWPERHTMLSDAISALESKSSDAAAVKERAESDRLRTLLARYIKHVEEREWVNHITTGSQYGQDKFTPAEWDELKKLAEWEART